MPIPFLLAGAAAAAGISGVKKGAKAVSNNNEAKALIFTAEQIYDNSNRKLDVQRNKTSIDLDSLGRVKLDAWGKEMDQFVRAFKSFKNITMEDDVHLNERLKMRIQAPDNLKNMEIASLKAGEVLSSGVSSLGAGALAGIASYGGAMMFASASTGTAIASLSGAAATNATLAWFGGGSIAAGGFGMAGGTLVLGGIVAGPVLAVAGNIMAAKSEENLSRARAQVEEARNAAAKMETMIDFMSNVSALAIDYESFIESFVKLFAPMIRSMENIRNQAFERIHAQSGYSRSIFRIMSEEQIDFAELAEVEQKTIHLSWLMAQILYSVLSAPLLTNKGDLDKEAITILGDAKSSIRELECAETEVEQMDHYDHGRHSAYDYMDHSRYDNDSEATNYGYDENYDSYSYNGERYSDAPIDDVDENSYNYQAKTQYSGEYHASSGEYSTSGIIQDTIRGAFGSPDKLRQTGKSFFENATDQMKKKGTSFLSKKLSDLADKLNEE